MHWVTHLGDHEELWKTCERARAIFFNLPDQAREFGFTSWFDRVCTAMQGKLSCLLEIKRVGAQGSCPTPPKPESFNVQASDTQEHGRASLTGTQSRPGIIQTLVQSSLLPSRLFSKLFPK
ncbi:hypothetical protein GRJ2_001404800 [Grus japonensis]|uniref:Uncharacterized protein n=1 Tax=Grus japonensis TaxID=30415 RepID=A0ABC9WVN6_GRUJA